MTALAATRRILDGFRPNRSVALPTSVLYAAASAATFLFAWQVSASSIPKPAEVWAALGTLWHDKGLFDQLATSFALNLQAIGWATLITLGLAYLTVLPAVRPLVAALSKLRFTGMVGWAFVFTLYAENGHQLKLWMLVFGTAPFFLTSMAAVVAEIPKERFDHARTLKMNEWRVVWEVVIRGTLDRALESLRQSAAMGWMMLTMVEGVVRSEGGIGALMLNENKHLDLAAVFALILVVLLVGVVQDSALAWLRRTTCPYADLGCERRSS
jgi:NitT/TauT family transport system permease protein